MNRKLLILVTISVLVGGTAIFIKNIESELPVGTIEIRNKVNGNYLERNTFFFISLQTWKLRLDFVKTQHFTLHENIFPQKLF